MESTGNSTSLPEEGGPRRSAGSNVSTTDRDGGQSYVPSRRLSSRQNVPSGLDSESLAHWSTGAGATESGKPAAGTVAAGTTTSAGGLANKSAAATGGGRLPRGVSFMCDEPSQEKSASRAGRSVSPGYTSRHPSSQYVSDSFGRSAPRYDMPKRAESRIGEPRRTLSGILRTSPAGGLGTSSSGKEVSGLAPLGRGEVGGSGFPMKSYASMAPEIMESFKSSSSKVERAEVENRGRSLSVTGPVAGALSSTRPVASRRSPYGDWGGSGGRSVPATSNDGSAGTRGGISSLYAREGRGRTRVGRQCVQRSTFHGSKGSNHAFAAAVSPWGGSTRYAVRGGNGAAGGGDEANASAGLLYRRSRAWAGPSRQLVGGGGIRTAVGGGRTTFRTCSDSHLGPQQQQYSRARKLHQDSGAAGAAGDRMALSGGGGERSSSGGNLSYYGRSRSTQQYMGRSAGSLWASRYSWLPVFSGPASYAGEEWIEYDRRMRGYWKQRVADATHVVATCVAKHVHVGATYGLYPLCSARLLMWLCLICSLYFLSVGLWLIVEDENYLECKLNYEAKGPQNGGSRYLLELIRPDMCGSRGGEITHLPGPVIYVYVEMEHVFQNDAQILWSRSWRQLAGEIITDPAELKECEPFITAEVDNKTKVLHPCGALAWNVLTDQYHFLEGPDDDDEQLARTPIHMNQSQAVVLEAYKGWERLYRNPSKAERAKYSDRVYFWMSPEDNDMRVNPNLVKEHARAELTADRLDYGEAGPMLENAHFIQWMTPGALGRWRKLYGRLTGPLKLPIYAYISSVYDISAWGGKKAIVLVQHSQFGGRTVFLGIMYVVLGCVLLILAVWLSWKSWHGRVDTDAAADLRWQSRKRSMKKSK